MFIYSSMIDHNSLKAFLMVGNLILRIENGSKSNAGSVNAESFHVCNEIWQISSITNEDNRLLITEAFTKRLTKSLEIRLSLKSR